MSKVAENITRGILDDVVDDLGLLLERDAGRAELAPWLITAQGHHLHILDPAATTIDLRDVAHASANTCRFLGHTRRFYSVAEHACRVHDLLLDWGQPEKVRLAGLLHEAGEVGFGDCPTPLKRQPEMAWYREREKALEQEVLRRVGVGALLARHRRAIKVADLVMLSTEKRYLVARPEETWGQALPAPLDVPWWSRLGWSPRRARGAFLNRLAGYVPAARWILAGAKSSDTSP